MSISKLEQVRAALLANPNIVIVGAPERNFLPGRDGFWSHTIDFHVAPKNGVYNAEELQTLMLSLVPDLATSCMDQFHQYEREMNFGKLYYDEDIGTRVTHQKLTLTDPSMFGAKGFVDGKRVIDQTEKIRRRTWVRLFPDIAIATAALGGNHVYSIPNDLLPQLPKPPRRGLVERLLGSNS